MNKLFNAITFQRYTALILILVVMSPLSAEPNPSFTMIGHIEKFTLTDASKPLSAASITVRGIPITIPSSLMIVMPGQYLTAYDLFRWHPSKHEYAAAPLPQSGLALLDNPAPPIPFEADIIGNIHNGEYIAGVVRISQGGLHITTGAIKSINADTGEFLIGARDGATVRVQLNDPQGIYGVRSKTLDQRFALDPDNSPVHAKTGFPVCLPRNDNRKAECPASNRPGLNDPLRFRFTCATKNARGQLSAPASPTAGAFLCDPTKPVPLAIGDYVSIVGMLAVDPTRAIDSSEKYVVAAHGLDAELGIYTSPKADPAYIFIEEALQGTKGEAFANLPQEETTRFRIVGFSTDPSRAIEVNLIDSGFPANRPKTRTSFGGKAGLMPSNGPQLGRFRNTWPAKDDARAVRRDVEVKIAGLNNPKPLSNGLTPGFYTAPISEYIFPEVTQFGVQLTTTTPPAPIPVPFENFCFLRQAGAEMPMIEVDASGKVKEVSRKLQAISPFPWSEMNKRSQLSGNPQVRVCND